MDYDRSATGEEMTVKQLIEALYMYDAGMKVYVRGFDECRIDDAVLPTVIRVKRYDENPKGHFGQHEESEDGEKGLLINFD